MLDAGMSCLIVIDVQGKLAALMNEKERLFKNIQILIQTAKILSFPILWCEQNPQALGLTVSEISQHLTDVKPVFYSCVFKIRNFLLY